jgi:hypothetical protein
MARGTEPSSLLLGEYLSSQDDRFIETLRLAHNPKTLISIAERWKKDPRPWARAKIIEYLDDAPHAGAREQAIVIKRLFKHAEAQRDHDLMGQFLVTCDRMVRRERITRYHYDWQARTGWTEQALFAPPGGSIFSNRTRNHLRRRAWRYFRRLGFQRSGEYIAAIAGALGRYRDEDLEDGKAILDCWGLMHACFFHSPVIEFGVSHAKLVAERSLAEMGARPIFPELWQDEPALEPLLGLLANARARLVRVWAMQLLRREHGPRLEALPPQRVIPLLDHVDEQVQQFAAELLDRLRGLDRIDPATWLSLLRTKSLTALGMICELMAKHVRPEQLSIEQGIELATARPIPVARLGLRMLQGRPLDNAALAQLADARCEAAGKEIAAWALGLMRYDTDTAARFFDSLNGQVRAGVWEWLRPASPGYNDSALFARLLETPHEDLRLGLVRMLQQRSGFPGADAAALAPLWCAVLLGIHRGGREKIKALGQISRAIRTSPQHAAELIPVAAIAIRSVRPAEARQGLAAIVGAVTARPELGPIVGRFLPELDLSPQGVGA